MCERVGVTFGRWSERVGVGVLAGDTDILGEVVAGMAAGVEGVLSTMGVVTGLATGALSDGAAGAGSSDGVLSWTAKDLSSSGVVVMVLSVKTIVELSAVCPLGNSVLCISDFSL